jgi:hypothetical protein
VSDSAKMTKLFSGLFGSALYGTKTPTSDRDVKHLTLVPLEDLLLCKKISNIVKKTNTAANTRNTVDDVDEEFIPLQVFARDFMMGQTYALEMAFALHGDHAEQQIFDTRGEVVSVTRRDGVEMKMTKIYDSFEEFDYETPFILDFVTDLRNKFLTSNIKAMMGYVVNQASLYSFKGERLNVSREFRDLLDEALGLCQTDQQLYTLGDIFLANGEFDDDPFGLNAKVEALQKKYPKYFKLSEYDIGGGRMKPCFTLLEKTFPFTNKLEHSITVADALINKYGSRADDASKASQTVDWKATMHALRIVDEGLTLLSSRELSFPFKQHEVDRYLAVRRGEVTLAEVTEELTSKLDQLKTLEQTTTLPAYNQTMQRDFDLWLASWMKLLYGL